MARIGLIRALLRFNSWLPLPVAHGIGMAIGSVASLLPGRPQKVVRINLALCFPELGPGERGRLYRASFRELGKQFMEAGIVWHASDARLRRLVRNPEALDTIASQWPEGRGLLIAGPHLGNWELAGLFINQRFHMHSLYRPPRARDLEPLLVELRQRTGAHSYPATASGIRQLYKRLRQGELVGVLPDQTPRDSGEFAPFFGVPARTMGLLSQMARKTGAPMLFSFMERLPWGAGFRLHVIPAPDGVDSDDPLTAATAVNAGVEACVRRAPAQYQWTYRRFRPAPAGQVTPYK